MNVLLLDDDALTRKTFELQLSRAGCIAKAVGTTDEAAELLARRAWDVVMTDLRTPGMRRRAFVRRIAREHPEARIIVATADASSVRAKEARELGVHAVWEKPFLFRRLAELLRALQPAPAPAE